MPDPKKPARWPKFLARTVYGTHQLSTILFALNQPRHPDHTDARAVVNILMAQGLSRAAVGAFNRPFGKGKIPLRLYWWRERDGKSHCRPDVPETRVSFALWHLLTSGGTTRLRQCPECGTYFFDRTRNASKRYCASRCASRATSRQYRAAGKEREARRARRVTTYQTSPQHR